MAAERWNMLHPSEERRQSCVETQLSGRPDGPAVAATDYIRAFAEQIRPYVKRRYHVLGTDGFGRSDYRRKLREHFEVDRHFVTVAALTELAAEGAVPVGTASEAIAKYGLNPDKSEPGPRVREASHDCGNPDSNRGQGPRHRRLRATCRSSRCTSSPVMPSMRTTR